MEENETTTVNENTYAVAQTIIRDAVDYTNKCGVYSNTEQSFVLIVSPDQKNINETLTPQQILFEKDTLNIRNSSLDESGTVVWGQWRRINETEDGSIPSDKLTPEVQQMLERFRLHMINTNNPHAVTKNQIGLGNVPNVSTNEQTPTYTQASSLSNLTSGEKLSVSLGKIMKVIADFITHKSSANNPHSVTKSQVGLGNVDNTSDVNKPVSVATQSALNGRAPVSHGSTSTTYGVGTGTVYGHVKLSDSISNNSTQFGGTAATPNAVKLAYDKANIKRNPADTNGDIISGHFTVGTRGNGVYGENSICTGQQNIAAQRRSNVIGGMGCESYAPSATVIASIDSIIEKSGSGYSAILGGSDQKITYDQYSSQNCIIAGGYNNTVTGQNGCTLGAHHAIANGYNVVMGRYNVEPTPGTPVQGGDVFVVGNGTSYIRSNAFRLDYAGNGYYAKSVNSTGADYAEMFEWEDGNKNNEDRRGRFVTLQGNKIRIANRHDTYILGVVSAVPAILGDSYDDQWQGALEKDVFGSPIMEKLTTEAYTDDNGIYHEAITGLREKLNPNYDANQEYIPRSKRKEWSPIGLHGKLTIIDDGTCVVDGYCEPSENGIATYAKEGYRVMERLDDTHIRVLIK